MKEKGVHWKKKKKKGCQEVNQRVLREALAECVQRQGESRLPSLPILEGSLNTRVPPHPRSHVPRVGKERWRNKLPGARSKWSQQHRKKKKKIKRWIGKREAFTVWCTADAHCAASAATWDGTSPSRRAAWHWWLPVVSALWAPQHPHKSYLIQ